MRKNKIISLLLGAVMLLAVACSTDSGAAGDMSAEDNRSEVPEADGSGSVSSEQTKNDEKSGESMTDKEDIQVENIPTGPFFKVDENVQYQTWESFGTSAAWWAQYVGGWDEPYREGELPVREQIAQYLFSRENGIGLTCYRYNLGAGSADSKKGTIWQTPRRAQSFIGVDGNYNWNKDRHAVWMLDRAVELGVEEVVLFCNSPLESLTINGLAHMSENGVKTNIKEENYDDFAAYCFDVAEHFIEEGYPVKFISPINEPQWDWYNGQEGCHYETEQLVDVLRAFVVELEKREALKGVEISGPESGEWKGKTIEYFKAIMKDEVLGEYFDALDCHSYWSDATDKKAIRRWLDIYYPKLKLRMSEWCEMVNGKDYTMDSAFNMADEIVEDMTILNVISWQNWVGVADGDYRDGLVYVNIDKKACRAAKRLWGYGNYTRYIRRGFVRVDISTEDTALAELTPVAFTGKDEDGAEKLVIVMINRGGEKEFNLDIDTAKQYSSYSVHTTSEEYDLEQTDSGEFNKSTVITLDAESIVTLVLQ